MKLPTMKTPDAVTETPDIAAVIARAIKAADQAVPEYRMAIERLQHDLVPRAADLDRRRSALVIEQSRAASAADLTDRARRLITDDAIPRHDRDRDAALKSPEQITDELAVIREAIRLT